MYNVNFGQDAEPAVDTSRAVEEPLPEDRTREVVTEEIPVVTEEEEVILVPAAVALSRGQKIGLGVGLGLAGLVVVGGIITAGVMKHREAY
jgi:hypothetical protein